MPDMICPTCNGTGELNRTCPECGQPVLKDNPDAIYCSTRHQENAKWKRWYERKKGTK
jgi:endogenous inhibitor of DNA gyrase (YacG/DUF329 family)